VSEYYSRNLSAARLKHAYDIASPRVKRYLDAELDHVMTKIRSDDRVIELGCGYGRILKRLAAKARFVIGVDTSIPTLELAKETLRTIPNCLLSRMNAARLGFQDQVFDCVVCIQNGISAFHVDQQALVSETVRVTRPGGIVLFSSYSDKFWKHRLEWFERQSEAGLLGEIDYEKTKDGTIVCKDGFTATTVREEDFLALTAHLGAQVLIVEVDESSLFCEITLPDSR
jgi:ubiquinone/menaquinone biosynthesis C-methylase UbiE